MEAGKYLLLPLEFKELMLGIIDNCVITDPTGDVHKLEIALVEATEIEVMDNPSYVNSPILYYKLPIK